MPNSAAGDVGDAGGAGSGTASIGGSGGASRVTCGIGSGTSRARAFDSRSSSSRPSPPLWARGLERSAGSCRRIRAGGFVTAGSTGPATLRIAAGRESESPKTVRRATTTVSAKAAMESARVGSFGRDTRRRRGSGRASWPLAFRLSATVSAPHDRSALIIVTFRQVNQVRLVKPRAKREPCRRQVPVYKEGATRPRSTNHVRGRQIAVGASLR